MCRVLSYLGQPLLIEELLYNPDNSFIQQSYDPKLMSHILNLAGFGLAAWTRHSHQPDLPFLYYTLQLPFYDKVLQNFSTKTLSHCFLAHLRGVDYSHEQTVSLQNLHPFMFKGSKLVLAHNGDLYHFDEMKYDLLDFILPEYRSKILGTTDSEWVYAVFMSQLDGTQEDYELEEIKLALQKTLDIFKKVRKKNNLEVHSPINLFISNGKFIFSLRYVLDFGNEAPLHDNVDPSEYHSLWYTLGEKYCRVGETYKMKVNNNEQSIIIASEPLTSDTQTWKEVAKQHYIMARIVDGKVVLRQGDIAE